MPRCNVIYAVGDGWVRNSLLHFVTEKRISFSESFSKCVVFVFFDTDNKSTGDYITLAQSRRQERERNSDHSDGSVKELESGQDQLLFFEAPSTLRQT